MVGEALKCMCVCCTGKAQYSGSKGVKTKQCVCSC